MLLLVCTTLQLKFGLHISNSDMNPLIMKVCAIYDTLKGQYYYVVGLYSFVSVLHKT